MSIANRLAATSTTYQAQVPSSKAILQVRKLRLLANNIETTTAVKGGSATFTIDLLRRVDPLKGKSGVIAMLDRAKLNTSRNSILLGLPQFDGTDDMDIDDESGVGHFEATYVGSGSMSTPPLAGSMSTLPLTDSMTSPPLTGNMSAPRLTGSMKRCTRLLIMLNEALSPADETGKQPWSIEQILTRLQETYTQCVDDMYVSYIASILWTRLMIIRLDESKCDQPCDERYVKLTSTQLKAISSITTLFGRIQPTS
jgi:hypothetical protein